MHALRQRPRRLDWPAGPACLRLVAQPDEILRALVLWSLLILPVGGILTQRIGRSEWTLPVERTALAVLIGLPGSAALNFLLSGLRLEAILPMLFAVLAATWAVVTLRWRARTGTRLDWVHPANGYLLASAGLAALVLTRGFAAFDPLPGGALAYPHSIEQAIHVAFWWELLRRVPPAELPTAAGLPFPRYHSLGYLPLTWPARWAGIGLLTAHHALVPPLAVTLVAVGVDVAMLAWLFGQVGWNGGRAALGILVATARSELRSPTGLHPMPLVAAFAGRRSVLEYRFLPLRFQSPRLHLAYQHDEVRLWRVARDASSVRPGPRFAPLGLR